MDDGSRRIQRKANAGSAVESILRLADNAEKKAAAGVESYYNDAFELAFYMPLILGDAITTSHEASEFYGVCIKSPSNQWFMTEKQGNTLVTSVYTQNSSEDVYIVFKLDYQSQDNYRFYCYQYTVDMQNRLFIYGDNSGEFVFLRYQTGANKEAFVLTRRAGGEGHLVSDETTVANAMSLVAKDFTSFNHSKIKGLKNTVDYTITQDEYTEAQMRVFPEALEREKGPLYNNNEGEMVCYGYGAEGESTVELPEGLTFGSDIDIYDYSGDVKELVLPADMRFTAEANTYFSNGGGFGIRLYRVYSNGQTEECVFEKITVKAGNSQLKSIEGNLYDQGGNRLLYLADNPNATSISLSFTAIPINGVSGMSKRKHIDKIESFDFPLIYRSGEQGEAPYNLFEQMIFGSCAEGETHLNLACLTVRGVKDRYDVYDFYTATSKIHKLVLYGSFSSVLIMDEEGLIQDVELHSSVAGAFIHKQSTLPSYVLYVDIRITEDGQRLNLAQFERVKSITIAKDVTYVDLSQVVLYAEEEIDIYLNTTLRSLTLPTIRANQGGGDKNGGVFVFGNYRVHFPCNEAQFDSFVAEKPDLKNNICSPYVKIFADTDLNKVSQILAEFPVVLEGEGLVIHNYFGTSDKVTLPSSVLGIPVVGVVFDGAPLNGKTPKLGYISELHIPAGLKYISFGDKSLAQQYHFGKVIYEGSYNAFTYISIYYDVENPYVGMMERFAERYDLLVTDDKTLSPLDKVYNIYVSFGAYTPSNMLVSYKHADGSYTFTADFLGTKVTGVLDENGKCTMNVIANGEVYVFVFTHF